MKNLEWAKKSVEDRRAGNNWFPDSNQTKITEWLLNNSDRPFKTTELSELFDINLKHISVAIGYTEKAYSFIYTRVRVANGHLAYTLTDCGYRGYRIKKNKNIAKSNLDKFNSIPMGVAL